MDTFEPEDEIDVAALQKEIFHIAADLMIHLQRRLLCLEFTYHLGWYTGGGGMGGTDEQGSPGENRATTAPAGPAAAAAPLRTNVPSSSRALSSKQTSPFLFECGILASSKRS